MYSFHLSRARIPPFDSEVRSNGVSLIVHLTEYFVPSLNSSQLIVSPNEYPQSSTDPPNTLMMVKNVNLEPKSRFALIS